MASLAKIEADISATVREIESLRQSQSSSLELLQKQVAEKEAAKSKALSAKKKAEGSVAATDSLVSGAEQDCEKVIKDGEKSYAK